MEHIHEENYKGYTIQIVPDECAENPFEGWYGMGKIVFHPRAEYSCNTDISYEEAKETKYSVPLSAYIHSGIVLSVLGEGYRCQWDTSDYIAYWIPDQVNAPVKSRKTAVKCARQACELFNLWANGEVYGYVVPETGDSCYGFFGDIKYPIEEAKSVIDHQIEHDKEGMRVFHALA